MEKQLLGLILVVGVIFLLVDEFHSKGEKHLSKTFEKIAGGLKA